jgi:hypothetical protein
MAGAVIEAMAHLADPASSAAHFEPTDHMSLFERPRPLALAGCAGSDVCSRLALIWGLCSRHR